ADRVDRREPEQPAYPGLHISDAALDRRRQPTLAPPAVVEPRLPIPGLPVSSCMPECPSVVQRGLDTRAAVLHFGREDNLAAGVVYHRQAGYPAARIDLQP